DKLTDKKSDEEKQDGGNCGDYHRNVNGNVHGLPPKFILSQSAFQTKEGKFSAGFFVIRPDSYPPDREVTALVFILLYTSNRIM
ncbi:MAG: hypothetical protein J5793_01625, partial [Clostridia bacterium]|nr:hypothetical protein [Clostridia bacterium]